MANLSEIVSFLDELLDTRNVSEPYGTNGLQVEASQQVTRVGFAVDACLESFGMLHDCQLVVVHHGLFWPKISRITGTMAALIGQLFRQGTSLYASHLPLDVHAELGNNAQILTRLGLQRGPLFAPVGYLAELDSSLSELHTLVESRIGPARLLPFGADRVTRVAVSSGQASVGMVDQAVSAGAQVMITGEAGHPIYHAAQQAGLSIMLAGHYQTEVWGVKALMPELQNRFGVQTRFVDIPTGF
ncbi:MAG: Nif3-like dinuclear metal center hexameric protein [Vulcanimicrobiota bacterium]